MLRSLWSWLGAKNGASEKVQPAGPPSFEPLEPRLLLDADLPDVQSFLACSVPSSEQAVHVDLDRQDSPTQTDVSPVLTIDFASGNRTDQPASTSVLSERPAEQTEYDVAAKVEGSGSPSFLGNDAAGLAVPGQQKVVLDPEVLPIEIRGPPATGLGSLSAPNRKNYSVESNSCHVARGDNILVVVGFTAPDVQGPRLVAPDISKWQGRITYLDFDGEQNVTCNGSVTAASFDVPIFQTRAGRARHEQVAIEHLLTKAGDGLAGSRSPFTTQPSPGIKYSTVGDDDSTFGAPFSSAPRSLSLALRGLSQNSLRYQLDKAEGAAHFIQVYGLKNVGENPKTLDREAVPCL